jgi:GTPase SAR1 family protein
MVTPIERPGIFVTDLDETERFVALEFFGDQERRVRLNLNEVRLRTLPDDVFALGDIHDLYLNVTDMKTIPESIQRLDKLTVLYLNNCSSGQGLAEFPVAIRWLPSLKRLGFVANLNLQLFPEGICCHLKKLRVLLMIRCGIKLLPSDFNEISELQRLDVTGSRKISNLSEAVARLEKLNYLAMEHERLAAIIEEVPPSIRDGLTSIRIRSDATAVIPHQLMLLKNLEALYFKEGSHNIFPIVRRHLIQAASRQTDLAIPPDEILSEGQEAVDTYYNSLVYTSGSRQKRVKVLLNGKSMAGKTSLLRAIELAIRGAGVESQGSCLTNVEDRTVSVEETRLHLGDREMIVNDTGGHEVYSLTNQLLTTDNSLIITAIDSTQYKMSDKQFYDQVGMYIDVVFDLLFKAVIVLVLTKIDLCPVSKQSAYANHIAESVEELVRERDVGMCRSRRATQQMTERTEENDKRRNVAVQNSSQRGFQNITVHKSVIMTSALSLEGLKSLTQCIQEFLHQPDFTPSVERVLPQSWIVAEDALLEASGFLTPPICTRQEVLNMLTDYQTHIGEDILPYLLTYLHKVGSVLHFPGHRVLCNYVFVNPQFVINLLKTLYRHDLKSLNQSKLQVDPEVAYKLNIDDITFEKMKTELAVNGSVDVNWLHLVWSQFKLTPTQSDLVLNLMFKFDLAYPKCANEEVHRMLCEVINRTDKEKVLYCSHLNTGDLYDVAFGEGKHPRVLPPLATLRLFSQSNETAEASDSLLGILESSQTKLLLPWFLLDTKPPEIPDTGTFLSDKNCFGIVVTYGFRYCLPSGLFHRLSARYSRHARFTRHWKSGLYFIYGPVIALFECKETRDLPRITLCCKAPKSANNPKRLWHVMWRCIEDMEDLLQAMPGVVVTRFMKEDLLEEEKIRVGIRESTIQPIATGPSFIIQEGAPGIDRNLLKQLDDVASHDQIASPLSEVFSYRCGDKVSQETIKAVARDKCLRESSVWIDVAEELNLPKDLIREVNDCCTEHSYPPPTLQMLQEWQEKVPECALVCVLYDALYSVGLKAVTNRHFSQYILIDRVIESPELERQGQGHLICSNPPAKAFLADQGWEYDVFICHTGDDKPFVETLYHEMHMCGLKAFYDKESLKMGDSVQATIARAIVNAPFCLVILSNCFQNKEYPEAEVKASLAFSEKHKRTIPIFYKLSADECHDLTRKMYKKLADATGIEKKNIAEDQFAKMISEAMKERAEKQWDSKDLELWKPNGKDWKPKEGKHGLEALRQLKDDLKAEFEMTRSSFPARFARITSGEDHFKDPDDSRRQRRVPLEATEDGIRLQVRQKESNALGQVMGQGVFKAEEDTPSSLATEVDHKVTLQQMVAVAQNIEDGWDKIASHVSPRLFTLAKLEEIESNYKSPFRRARAMLEMWSKDCGHEATCRTLIHSLCRTGYRAVAIEVFGSEMVRLASITTV